MPSGYQPLRVYQELADWYERQAQAQLRDRFLLLAADAALSGGQADEAERLRIRLLQQSPHHMLKPFASFAEATRSPDVQGYLSDLRQTYPPEAAAEMLASLRGGEAGPQELPPPAPPPEPPPPARTALPPTRTTEPLKVFRVKEESAAADAPPRNAPPPRPGTTRKTVPPPPAPPPRPAPRSVPPTALPPTAGVPLPPLASAPPPRRAAAPPVAVAPPPARPVAPIPIADAPPPRPLPLPRGDLKPKATDPEPLPDRGGAWVSVALFVLVLTAGLALTVWTLGRPFFPPGWLP